MSGQGGGSGSRPPRLRPRRYLDDVGPLVDAIPRGRVLTYGDVAELTGWGAPRAVGAVMAEHGLELPWWRVVRADGSLVSGLLGRARVHWADEGTPLVRGGGGVDLALARWSGPEVPEERASPEAPKPPEPPEPPEPSRPPGGGGPRRSG